MKHSLIITYSWFTLTKVIKITWSTCFLEQKPEPTVSNNIDCAADNFFSPKADAVSTKLRCNLSHSLTDEFHLDTLLLWLFLLHVLVHWDTLWSLMLSITPVLLPDRTSQTVFCIKVHWMAKNWYTVTGGLIPLVSGATMWAFREGSYKAQWSPGIIHSFKRWVERVKCSLTEHFMFPNWFDEMLTWNLHYSCSALSVSMHSIWSRRTSLTVCWGRDAVW